MSPAARADGSGLALNRFEPAPAGDALFTVPSAFVSTWRYPNAYLMVDYAKDPLRVHAGDTDGSIVASQAYVRGDVSLGFANRFQLSLDMPVAVQQTGDSPTLGGLAFASPTGVGLGDLRVGARLRLFGSFYAPLQLAIGAYGYAPIGASPSYTADGKARGGPHLIVGGRKGRFIYGATGGYVYHANGNPNEVTFSAGIAAVYGHGARIQIGPEVHGSFEVGGASPLTGIDAATKLGAEALVGAKIRIAGGLYVGLAGGPGLTNAIGTPSYRGVATLGFQVDPKVPLRGPDTDRDGVLDVEDACRSIPGPRDAANPLRSGCPDQDRDAIIDPLDACVSVAGIAHPNPKKNGCPADRDDDGVLDAVDACPDVAGSPSPDPKKNGCVPDRDGDGIGDAVDACPDLVGVASSNPKINGCPDKDGDGVIDSLDACPDEKGPVREDPKTNGCAKQVVLTEKEIVILSQVRFMFGKGAITETVDPVSSELLSEVRDVIEQHPEIIVIEVQGHTDSVGDAAANRKLSRERAESVRNWLVERGIAQKKLVAMGYGAYRPIATNATDEGRTQNRRVQFIIRERKARPKK